jgi:hypothetical protein
VLPRGGVGGVAPPGKNFFGKNLKGGTKVKFTLDFLRNLRENLKGGPKDILTLVEKNLELN